MLNELAISSKHRFLFLYLSNSTFDVGRSMFDVHLSLRKKDSPRQTAISTTHTEKASVNPDMG